MLFFIAYFFIYYILKVKCINVANIFKYFKVIYDEELSCFLISERASWVCDIVFFCESYDEDYRL